MDAQAAESDLQPTPEGRLGWLARERASGRFYRWATIGTAIALAAILTRPDSPYGRTTSRIGVETTGRPAAKYSGVFVGLMNCVDSLIANGIIATSHPAIYSGNSS